MAPVLRGLDDDDDDLSGLWGAAVTEITNAPRLPGDQPFAPLVGIELIDDSRRAIAGYVPGTAQTVQRRLQFRADGNNEFSDALGEWSVDLVPNAWIVPEGTLYRVTEQRGRSLESVHIIEIPEDDGPYTVLDVLVDAPGSSASQLLAHVSDEVDAHDAASVSVEPVGNLEAEDAQSAFAELDAQLTAEAAARAAADSTEATTRGAADTTLATNLATETTARIAGDSAATSAAAAAVAAEAATRATADTTEATTRAAADTAATAALAAHAADTTAIHGIADTSALVLTGDARLSDTRTPTDNSVTQAKVPAGALGIDRLAVDPRARGTHTGFQLAETISDLTAAVRANRLDQMAAPTAAVSVNGQRVTNGVLPVADTDLITKEYADGLRAGILLKADPVRVMVATNVNINAPGAVHDGATLTAGVDSILLTGQTSANDNGIYLYNGPAVPLTRRSDANVSAEMRSGTAVWVLDGTYADQRWALVTADPITLGVTAQTWAFDGGLAHVTAGTGLTKTGNTIGIAAGGVGTTQLADASVTAAKVVANTFALATGDTTGGGLTLIAGTAATVPQTIKGAASQTADFFRVVDSAGVVLGALRNQNTLFFGAGGHERGRGTLYLKDTVSNRSLELGFYQYGCSITTTGSGLLEMFIAGGVMSIRNNDAVTPLSHRLEVRQPDDAPGINLESGYFQADADNMFAAYIYDDYSDGGGRPMRFQTSDGGGFWIQPGGIIQAGGRMGPAATNFSQRILAVDDVTSWAELAFGRWNGSGDVITWGLRVRPGGRTIALAYRASGVETVAKGLVLTDDGRAGIGIDPPLAKLDVLANEATIPVAILRGMAGQTGNLQEWQDPTPTVLASVGPTGRMRSADGNLAAPGLAFQAEQGSGLYRPGAGDVRLAVLGVEYLRAAGSQLILAHPITARVDTAQALIVKGVALQSANLTEWRDSTDAVVAAVTNTGRSHSPAGTVGAPAAAFLADVDTGWYNPSANALNLVTGGADALFINNQQQVGIGVTPAAKLHVLGTGVPVAIIGHATAPRLQLQRAGVNVALFDHDGTAFTFGTQTSSSIALVVDGQIRSRWDTSGNCIVATGVSVAGGRLHVESPGAGVALLAKGGASNASDIQQWQDETGVAGFAVTSARLPKWSAAAMVQTTVGAAGAAAAPPATPTKYLKVVGDDGVTYVVPAYAAA